MENFVASLEGVNRLSCEKFTCHQCEKNYSDDDVRKTWRCPDCGDYIYIYAEDADSNTRIVLLRKRASEVTEGDMVHLPGSLTKECNQVLGVRVIGNKLGLGLKGYGTYKISPEDPVNIRTGSW